MSGGLFAVGARGFRTARLVVRAGMTLPGVAHTSPPLLDGSQPCRR
jgi:hypothetical protein